MELSLSPQGDATAKVKRHLDFLKATWGGAGHLHKWQKKKDGIAATTNKTAKVLNPPAPPSRLHAVSRDWDSPFRFSLFS